jgi:hypothetical protein
MLKDSLCYSAIEQRHECSAPSAAFTDCNCQNCSGCQSVTQTGSKINFIFWDLTLRWFSACEADSFRNIKVKISYTPEDGHVGRNM